MASDRNYLLLTAVPQMDQQLSTQILHPLNFVNDDKARFFYLRQVLVSTMLKIPGFWKYFVGVFRLLVLKMQL